MIDWVTSIFPHRCWYCKRWIKPKVRHIGIYKYDYEERYCDPHCARCEVERQRKIACRREELAKIIYGGEE